MYICIYVYVYVYHQKVKVPQPSQRCQRCPGNSGLCARSNGGRSCCIPIWEGSWGLEPGGAWWDLGGVQNQSWLVV